MVKRTLNKNVAAFCLSFGLMLLIASAAHARIFQHIVAFGDSLSDHYGLQSYLGPYDPVTNPNGALEVWSNGDVWVEYLANNWGATLDNNAIAGAMTLGHENEALQAQVDVGALPPLGLVGQVDLYTASGPVIDSDNTLFTIWIGANDLMEFGRGESHTADPNVMITDAMNNIANSVESLYDHGARYFLFLNVPDIGKSPGYRTSPPDEVNAVTALVQSYNSALAATIESLELNFSGIAVYSVDMFAYLDEMINSGIFVNVTDTYMTLDAQGNKTGGVNGNADDYLFWDNIHPMTRAHSMVADRVEDTPPFKDTDSSSNSLCFISSVVRGQAKNPLHTSAALLLAVFTTGMAAGFSRKR